QVEAGRGEVHCDQERGRALAHDPADGFRRGEVVPPLREGGAGVVEAPVAPAVGRRRPEARHAPVQGDRRVGRGAAGQDQGLVVGDSVGRGIAGVGGEGGDDRGRGGRAGEDRGGGDVTRALVAGQVVDARPEAVGVAGRQPIQGEGDARAGQV